MSETKRPRSYTVLTSGSTYSGTARPDTRIEGVSKVTFEDGLLVMEGSSGELLFMAPLAQVVYVKSLEPQGHYVTVTGGVATVIGGTGYTTNGTT